MIHEKFPTVNKKIILGDTAYDSVKISSEVKTILDSELLGSSVIGGIKYYKLMDKLK